MSEVRSKKPAASSSQGSRQSRSCKVCRIRKVKCDRVRPCQPCCTHGHPSKCVYEIPPGEDFKPISQADEIRKLRAEIRQLESQLAEDSAPSNQRSKQLHFLFETLRFAPEHVVDRVISKIRSSHGEGSRKDLFAEPWNSWDGSKPNELPLITHGIQQGGIRSSIEGEDDQVEVSDLIVRRSSSRQSESSDDSSNAPIYHINSEACMLDVFIERFIDAFSPEVDAKAGQAGAIRRAAEIRMFSPILEDAFQTVSRVFFGRSVQNKWVEVSGFSSYPRVLRRLQDSLLDPEGSKAESTLATVILLMAFESVERTSQASLTAHVQGAVRLIEHRGPENHIYGVEHLLFTELRPYWVASALTQRKPSFLAREEWKTIPWSEGTTPKNILHYLLDLAVEIPTLLFQHDELQADMESNTLSNHERSVKTATLWKGVKDVTDRFEAWKIRWIDNYPDGPPIEVPAADEARAQFPVFHCRDLRTGAIITPSKFIYPDLLTSQTMCIYYATRLILSTADTRPTGVTPLDQYQLACGICRSLEWYILTSPGNMINRLAFPVRVAWEALPDRGPERKFLYAVLKLVEKRHSLGLWGGGMEDISPRQNSPSKSDSSARSDSSGSP
ncbi:hypothetical protein BDV18DRAFT_161802 [Aspergillus unguis]